MELLSILLKQLDFKILYCQARLFYFLAFLFCYVFGSKNMSAKKLVDTRLLQQSHSQVLSSVSFPFPRFFIFLAACPRRTVGTTETKQIDFRFFPVLLQTYNVLIKCTYTNTQSPLNQIYC